MWFIYPPPIPLIILILPIPSYYSYPLLSLPYPSYYSYPSPISLIIPIPLIPSYPSYYSYPSYPSPILCFF